MKNNEICPLVAIVTGAIGIGRGIAERLAQQGSIVLMADIDEKKVRISLPD